MTTHSRKNHQHFAAGKGGHLTDGNGPATDQRGPIIVSLQIAAFVAFLSQTLLNVALPTMMDDLGIGEATIEWLITGYMLVNGILVPISAFLIDRFTTRQLFLWATGLFAAGTIMCAAAPGFGMLLAGRLFRHPAPVYYCR